MFLSNLLDVALGGWITDQEQSGPMPQHRVKYSMPDTDDEGSVTDSASDAGKGAPATASAHGSVKGMKVRGEGEKSEENSKSSVLDKHGSCFNFC